MALRARASDPIELGPDKDRVAVGIDVDVGVGRVLPRRRRVCTALRAPAALRIRVWTRQCAPPKRDQAKTALPLGSTASWGGQASSTYPPDSDRFCTALSARLKVGRPETDPCPEVRSVNFSGRPMPTGRAAIAVCALLMVAVTALRLAVSNPIEAVGFLYVIPISLAAVEFGWRGGLAAAAGAILLTVFWAELQNVPLGVVGYAARGFTFTSIGLLIGLQAEQRRVLLEDRERLVDELRATAMRDQLTGLANRRASDERLAYELRTAARSARPLSVAMVDLDKLKLVNDRYGHAQGDRLLQRCAQALRIAARETDLIARLGGDEFLVLLPDCPATEAREVALRLLDALRPDHSASIGIATWEPPEPGDELISRADQAMYRAKMAGGARITLAQEPPPSRPLLAAI